MAIVWDHYPQGGSEKLTLLALADWCNDKGESLHPSVASIAMKVCVRPRRAQQILSQFVSEGLLEVVGNALGGAPGSTRQYRLRLDRIKAMTPSTGETGCTPPITETGATQCTPTGAEDCTPTGAAQCTPPPGGRVQSMVETGATQCTRTTIEPPEDTLSELRSSRVTHSPPRGGSAPYPKPADVPDEVWSTWLQVRRAKKAGAVTAIAMRGIEREAGRAGLTVTEALTICCERSWQSFNAGWHANLLARSGTNPSRLSPTEKRRQANDEFMAALTGRGNQRTIDVEAHEVADDEPKRIR